MVRCKRTSSAYPSFDDVGVDVDAAVAVAQHRIASHTCADTYIIMNGSDFIIYVSSVRRTQGSSWNRTDTLTHTHTHVTDVNRQAARRYHHQPQSWRVVTLVMWNRATHYAVFADRRLLLSCRSYIWVQTWTSNIISYLPQMMYSLLILCLTKRTPQLYCVACVTDFTVICTTINGSYTYINIACLILCQVLKNWNVSYKYKVFTSKMYV